MLRRVMTIFGVLLALGLLASSSALAAEPPGANGYHSAFGNLTEKMAATRASQSAAQASGKAAPAASIECGAQGYIRSKYNGLYVSDELGFGGGEHAMLRARSTSVGPWELWEVCYFNATGYYSIYSDANKLWVSTEVAGTGELKGMLRARSETVGAWEQYEGTLLECYAWFRSHGNGLDVTAEFSYTGNHYGMLRARSTQIGQWEEFTGSVFNRC